MGNNLESTEEEHAVIDVIFDEAKRQLDALFGSECALMMTWVFPEIDRAGYVSNLKDSHAIIHLEHTVEAIKDNSIERIEL